MQATTVLYGQVLVVLAITLSGIWSATQWTAAALGYQSRLGAPWFEWLGMPIYHPWRLFEWWFFFDAYAPNVFNVGGSIAACSSLLALAVAIGMALWRARQARGHRCLRQNGLRPDYLRRVCARTQRSQRQRLVRRLRPLL